MFNALFGLDKLATQGRNRYILTLLHGKRCLKSLDPNETRERVLNDRIADQVEKLLKDYDGVSVLRLDDSDDGAEDVALEKRVQAANTWEADIYLSIHHNAGIDGGSARHTPTPRAARPAWNGGTSSMRS